MTESLSAKRIFGNAGASVAQSLVATVSLFVLYRTLLNTLGAEQLGVWSIVFAAVSAGKLAELGIGNGVVKFISASIANQTHESQIYLRTAITLVVISSVLVLGSIYFISPIFLPYLVGEQHGQLAYSLLPYALYCFFTATVAGVYQSALDALLITKQRAYISILTTLLYVGLATFLSPRYGLYGVAIAQALQNTVLLFATYSIAAKSIHTTTLYLNPFGWSKLAAVSLIRYGFSAQLAALSITLLCEPLTKSFLTKFAGVQSVTYFDMATRIITQFRSIILSAYQAVVPIIARMHETDKNEKSILYSHAMTLVIPISIGGFFLIATLSPSISRLWIGSLNIDFIQTMVILTVGWFINTAVVPTYMMNLGSGSLLDNTISHAIIGFINITIGYIGGIMFGFVGVLWGWTLGLVAGSIYLLVMYQFRNVGHIISQRFLHVLSLALHCLIGTLLFSYSLHLTSPIADILLVVGCSLLTLLVCGWIIWKSFVRQGVITQDFLRRSTRTKHMFHQSSQSYL